MHTAKQHMYKLIFTLVAGLFLVSPVMAQVATMTEVGDDVYHFWDSGYSSMVVIGKKGVLVTDPAFSPRAETLKAEIEYLTDKPVKWVVLSHEHYDHAGGTEVFEDAQVVCHRACEDILSLSPLLPMPEVDITFKKSRTINLGGGQRVKLLHIAVGDGVGTTVVHVKPSGVVFSADMYQPEAFTVREFKDDMNFVGAREILNTIIGWNPTYAINAHSPGNSFVALRENAELYDLLYGAILERAEAAFDEGGVGAAIGLIFTLPTDLPGELDLQPYVNWDNFEAGLPNYVLRMTLSIIHGG